MSPSAPSTPKSASSSGSGSASCTRRSPSPPCWSPTIRKRRWRWPTASPSSTRGDWSRSGPPAEIYDQPHNEFVMKFLGPATELDGAWVRPHDLVLHRDRGIGGHVAGWSGSPISASRFGSTSSWTTGAPHGSSSARGAANELDLVPGDQAWVTRATPSSAPLLFLPGGRLGLRVGGRRDLLVHQSWPHQVQYAVGNGLAEGAMPHKQAKPQGAIENIEGLVDVQVGSQLAGGDAFCQGCCPPGSAVSEEPGPGSPGPARGRPGSRRPAPGSAPRSSRRTYRRPCASAGGRPRRSSRAGQPGLGR